MLITYFLLGLTCTGSISIWLSLLFLLSLEFSELECDPSTPTPLASPCPSKKIILKKSTPICRGGAAKFPNRSIMFEKYNFSYRSIFFSPISVHFEDFIVVFGNTDPDAHTA